MPETVQRIIELEKEISELKGSIEVLEAQLKQAREAAQHEAIDHLEDYINAVDLKYTSVRSFFKMLMDGSKKS